MRVYTVATLPPVDLMSGQYAMVTDGSTAADCTVGNGSPAYVVVCKSDGSTYAPQIIGSPGAGTLTVFSATPSNWPSWLIPSVSNSTTTPSLSVTTSNAPFISVTGNMVNGNVPKSTGINTLADGGQAYPAGPFADTTSAQTFLNKDLSSSTNILPNTVPLLSSNNVFTGLNTFRTPAGTSDIIISTGAAGQQAFTRYDDLGTEKWAIGKNNDNTFFLFDEVHNSLPLSTDSSGGLILGVDTNIAPATASGLSNSHALKMTARNSGGTSLINTFTADSNGSMNWQPGADGLAFNLVPISHTNTASPVLQFLSYNPSGVLNVAKINEDTSGNIVAGSGTNSSGFYFFNNGGTPLGEILPNGNVAAVNCMQLNSGSGASWCQGSGAPASTPTYGSLFSRTDTGQLYTYTGGRWDSLIGGCPNILNYGGFNDGVTSNNAAWTAALAAGSATKACVYFPGPGNYFFASATSWSAGSSNSVVTVKGDGSGITTLTFGAGGMVFNGSHNGDAVHVEDLTMATSTVGTATAITLQNSGAQNGFAASNIKNVSFLGADGYAASDYWANAVTTVSWSGINFEKINITGSPILSGQSGLGTGITLGKTGSVPGVIYNFHDVTHSYGAVGINIGDLIQGVTVSQSNFTAVERGIYAPPGDAYGDDDQVVISDSQFAAHTAGIDIESPIRHTNIHGNYFIVPTGGTAAIFNNYAMTNISNNQLICVCGGDGNGIVFSAYSNDASQAINNQTQFFTTAIWLQTTSAHTAAYGNQGTSNTTDLINTGTANPSSVTFTGASTGSFQVQDGYVIHQ